MTNLKKKLYRINEQYLFCFLSACLIRSQKQNHQVFLFNLLMRWNGLSFEGRRLLQSSGLDIPKSTFYLKLSSMMEDTREINRETIMRGPFALWIDNLTKVFSRDYQFHDVGRLYKVNDLTVCGAFMAFDTEKDHHIYRWYTMTFDNDVLPTTSKDILLNKFIIVLKLLGHNNNN